MTDGTPQKLLDTQRLTSLGLKPKIGLEASIGSTIGGFLRTLRERELELLSITGIRQPKESAMNAKSVSAPLVPAMTIVTVGLPLPTIAADDGGTLVVAQHRFTC